MTKIKILVCALTVLCAASCSKDKIPTSLTGTKWGAIILEVKIQLSFDSSSRGRLTLTGGDLDGVISFEYTYTSPYVVLTPDDRELGIDRINAKVVQQGNVMEFSDIRQYFPEPDKMPEIVLNREKK